LTALAGAQWSEHEIFGIHLAVEEALVNAIRHGNGLDPSKMVSARFRLSRDRLEVEITDEGNGFNPAKLPDPTDSENIEAPCGRGVLLMRNFMNRVEYNDRGNRVIMEKRRDGQRASA
jgi:serine/threonine-protein kinase RsbW